MPARSREPAAGTVTGMSGRAQLMWDETVTGYDFGPRHPMDPVRLTLTRGLISAYGVDRQLKVTGAKPAGDSTLRLVHRQDYVDAVKAVAAEAVWRGEAEHAVNFSGGLHHAMPGAASGFCVYNDAALAIARLLELGAERVAYVDVDVHHGDGVQAAFWEDPRVLTVSLHEHPRTLFPQTGWPEETGAPGPGEGGAVNVALPAGTGDAGW